MAHYAPFPAIASVSFLDIVTFRGLPTYRVTLADGEGTPTSAYYLVRRLDDGSLRIAGCILVRVPSIDDVTIAQMFPLACRSPLMTVMVAASASRASRKTRQMA
jgi:hypothetical protein